MGRHTILLSLSAFLFGSLLTVGLSAVLRGSSSRSTAATSPAPADSLPAELPVITDQTETISATSQLRDLHARIARERRTILVEAIDRVDNSVAAVEVLVNRRVNPLPQSTLFDRLSRDFFDQWFAFRGYAVQRIPSGTALVISADGEIVTNYHVIADGEQVFVTLADGRTSEAEVVGFDSSRDLALLRVDLDDLEPATFGSSSHLLVGEWVVAVGYPVVTRPAQPTVTVGVVSATQRTFQPQRQGKTNFLYADMIQTDAAINPGNSGGPLANAAGEVIGLNTFILTESGGSEGLGFAIPINRILRAASEIRKYGRVRPILQEFNGQTVTQEVADALAMPVAAGVIVSAVRAGSATERAGLQQGDVIMMLDDKPVNSMVDLVAAISPHFVGDTARLHVWRANGAINIELLLNEASPRQ